MVFVRIDRATETPYDSFLPHHDVNLHNYFLANKTNYVQYAMSLQRNALRNLYARQSECAKFWDNSGWHWHSSMALLWHVRANGGGIVMCAKNFRQIYVATNLDTVILQS